MSSIDLTEPGLQTGSEAGVTEGFESLRLSPALPLEEEIIARASANYEPLPMLEVIFGRLVTSYAPMLKSQGGFLCEATSHKLSYQSWGRAVEALDEFGVAAMAASSQGGDIAIAFDGAFLHGAIGSMLGGKPGPADVLRRVPTTLEKAFAHRLIQDSLSQLSQLISRIVEVNFTPDAVEAPAQINSFHNGNAITAVLEMQVQIGLLPGRVSILLPMQTLEPMRPQLGKMFLGEELGRDIGWRDHFAGHISGASMTLTAELHRLSLPLADVLRWQPGAVIDLGITEDHEASLICSERAILHGATGRRRNGRLAMRITREAGEPTEGEDDDILTD